ncbi:MAG TPA: iron-containing alcohol dehydrogenase, partial [Candidatus Wallbacteria bacterium]|nr:iron-containing alcohol dehydrogenase [Candidatus Wallbacteria bacterium]
AETERLSEHERKNVLIEKVKTLKRDAGITKTLGGAGVKASDIPTLAKKAHNDPCLLTNPRKASVRDLEVIYEQAV